MHVVAVPVSDRTPVFELAIPCAVFGRPPIGVDAPWYEFRLCRVGRPVHVHGSALQLNARYPLDALADADTVIVPASPDADPDPPRSLLEALVAAHERGARIASICSGAFIPAPAR